MSKKTTGFDLINSNFRLMSTCTSLLHKLSSHEFWPLCTEYSTSRVKTQACFKDQTVYTLFYKNNFIRTKALILVKNVRTG